MSHPGFHRATRFAVLAVITCQGCQEGTWKSRPDETITVRLGDGERVSGEPPRIAADGGTAPVTTVRAKIKEDVRTDEPGVQMVCDMASTLPTRALRWMQIVVATNPRQVPDATRPNFDAVMTKGEAALNPQPNPREKAARDGRIRDHNPFKHDGRRFTDEPSKNYARFETYIILVYIVEKPTPRQWKAERF